jgi:hypothetical protein
MRGFIALLFTGLVALVAGTIGYQAGAASTVAAGTGVSFLLLAGLPHLFGFLFFLLFIGFVASMIAGRRRHWAGDGPMGMHGGPGRWGPMGPMGGPGRFGQMDENDPRRQWVAEAHRRLHEADAARAAGTGAAPTTPTAPSASPADTDPR